MSENEEIKLKDFVYDLAIFLMVPLLCIILL